MTLSTLFICDLMEFFNIARVVFLHSANQTVMDDVNLATSCFFAKGHRTTSVSLLQLKENNDLPEIPEKTVIVDLVGQFEQEGYSNRYFSQNYFWIVLSNQKGDGEEVPGALRLDSNFLVVQTGTTYNIREFYRIKGNLLSSFFGSWNIKSGLKVPIPEKWRRRGDLGGVRLRGGTKIQALTMMPVPFAKEPTFIGVIPEFMESVAGMFNFSLEYVFPADNMWGSKLDNGSWGGVLGLLERGEVDIVTAGMANVLEREEITSYVTGVMFVRNALFILDPAYVTGSRSSLNFAAYLSIFTPNAWVIICTAFFTISAFLLIMLNIVRHKGKDTSVIEKMGLSVEYTFRALVKLENGASSNSLGAHFKLFHLFVALFAMVAMAYYEGMLTSFMTAKPSPPKIRSFSDILHFGYKVKLEIGSAQELELKYSAPGSGKQRVYQELVKDNPDAVSKSITETAQEMKENPKLAAFTHEFAFHSQPQMQPLLGMDDMLSLPISLSLAKDSELMDALNYQVIKMHESGLIGFLTNKWLYQREPGELCSPGLEQISAEPIGYDNLFFAMCIMLFGTVCALVLVIGERILKFLSAVRHVQIEQFSF